MELWLCASPDYIRVNGTPRAIQDLAKHELVDRDAVTQWEFEVEGHLRRFESRVRAVIPDAAAQQAVVIRGYGIGRLPAYLAKAAVVRGDLVRIMSDQRSPVVPITAIYPSHRSLSARVRVFIDALVEHMTSEA